MWRGLQFLRCHQGRSNLLLYLPLNVRSAFEYLQIVVEADSTKGLPAAVKIFKVPNFASPVSQKSFFKGDKAQMKWNQNGTSLIVLAQTEVDKSGKSYYGETTLYLMSANGGFDSRIDLGISRFS